MLLNRRWQVVSRLRPVRGLALFLLLAAPWYVAMLVKYGQKFFNEFFLHHNLQRAFTGVHGERGGFEYFVKQLGYGVFPWVALLPAAGGWAAWRLWRPQAAVVNPAVTARQPEPLAGFTLLWLGITFTTFTLMVTKFHHYVFPAVPPLAILVGLALGDDNRSGWRWLAPLGVLVLAMVANDIVSSPAPLSNLCTYAYERPLPVSEYPAMFYLGLSMVLGLALLAGGVYPRSRWPLRLLVGGGLLAAALLAWSYLPALGHTLSQQDLFDTHRRLARPGDRFYQYQMNWRGEVFYSRDTIVKLGSEAAVESTLKQPGRVFILSVADAFSAIDRAARRATGKHLHVLTGSNLRYTLASNQLDPGEPDLNPITRNLFSSDKPPTISHPLRAEFAEGVAFLGYDLEPSEPRVGDKFTLTLYWQCLRPVAKAWRVFVHVDGHGHEFYRINGDHDPVGGMFPTDRWLPGDIVRDRVVLSVPIEYRPGRFTLYLGMYSGTPRMRVLPGFPQDGNNRVRAGIINIR
ncbi:MAG: hypothetical protein DRI34_09385 [Deltaproteobacteria bacterium]|nr:MAG: hypothetical protein DRI34_09385 [Deltaproteobacteria bacterium]